MEMYKTIYTVVLTHSLGRDTGESSLRPLTWKIGEGMIDVSHKRQQKADQT